VDRKEHPTQIDAVLVLSNGDIAVSGGPRKFEILIYRHNFTA
jgi:prolyl-tRNA editing enzyme YbaK/EbsC (Cys-tRNA(Pro) deacylase)